VAELDGANNVLREQLDRSNEREDASVREVQRALDKTEFELSRAKERLAETEGRLSAEQTRVSGLEKELSTAQEQIFRRDRQLREERERGEVALIKLEECRNRYEEELSTFRAQLVQERHTSSELTRKHKAEIEGIREEVSARLPAIAASAAERVEEQCSMKAHREMEALKLQYESNLQRMRRDVLRLQSELAETEAKYKSVTAEERAELERLRGQVKRFQRRSEELEEQLDSSSRRTGSSHTGSMRQMPERDSFASALGAGQGKEYQPQSQSQSFYGGGGGQPQIQGDVLAILLQGQLTSMQQQLSQSLMGGNRFLSQSHSTIHPSSIPLQGPSVSASYSIHNLNENTGRRQNTYGLERSSIVLGGRIDQREVQVQCDRMWTEKCQLTVTR